MALPTRRKHRKSLLALKLFYLAETQANTLDDIICVPKFNIEKDWVEILL